MGSSCLFFALARGAKSASLTSRRAMSKSQRTTVSCWHAQSSPQARPLVVSAIDSPERRTEQSVTSVSGSRRVSTRVWLRGGNLDGSDRVIDHEGGESTTPEGPKRLSRSIDFAEVTQPYNSTRVTQSQLPNDQHL